MTTKTELLEELKKSVEVIQQKIAEIAEIEEQDDCLIDTKKYTNRSYYLANRSEDIQADSFIDNQLEDMHFADEEQCKRYAEALTTFILLRKQPGSEVAKDFENQKIIALCNNRSLTIKDYSTWRYKITEISPCFNSEESALKAIETLGEERILNMFKYFHS